MRLRLFLSFLLIIIVTSIAIVLLTTMRVLQDVVQFLTRGGLTGNEELVKDLETHYQLMGSWDDVEEVMIRHSTSQGSGMGPGSPVTLANKEGNIISNRGPQRGPGVGRRQNPLTETELSEAITLFNDREIIGYLLPDQRIVPLPGIEVTLLQRLSRSALTAAGIATVLSLVFSILLAYALLRPIRELTKAARAMGRGDLNQRVQPSGNNEMALLAETFNDMADSLQQAETRRRALTADIAHELRNPLAIQRANIEAMQDGLYPTNNEQLEPIRQQNLQLERLVEDLRTLALADTGHLALERTRTSLPELLQRRLDELKPEADAKNITLHYKFPESIDMVNLDPSRFGQIITNLMGNAMRYSPEDGTIFVEVSENPRMLEISVRDQGPGISKEDLPLIFERFYRSDKARNRDQGSTGLGLSIAKRLAQAHGGSLEASNHPGGGAVFKLNLPK